MSVAQKCDSLQAPWDKQTKRFGVYENGFYSSSFDTYEEAIAYAKKWIRYGYVGINDKTEWENGVYVGSKS